MLGEPIRCFGEHAGWNRRRHVRYKVGDDQHTLLVYSVRVQRRIGHVYVDLKKTFLGCYQIRYVSIDLVGRPGRTIIVQDIR